jgi:hypothetical protein
MTASLSHVYGIRQDDFSRKINVLRINAAVAARCSMPPRLTKIEIAAKLGIGRTLFHSRLAGGSRWRSEELIKLAKIIGVNPDFFIDDMQDGEG